MRKNIICPKCNKEMLIGSVYCNDCKKEYDRQYYNKNKEKLKSIKNERSRKSRKILRKLISEYKSVPCFDCKQRYHPCQMDFDHLRDKEWNVSSMPGQGFAPESVLKEIAKCEVVCANCHRLRTFTRLNNKNE